MQCAVWHRQPTTKTEWLGITMLMMLISDKSQLKGNSAQIGFQIALKTKESSADLTDSGILFHTFGPATEKFLSVEQCSLGCWQNEDVVMLVLAGRTDSVL